jgi:perosamine synthetase
MGMIKLPKASINFYKENIDEIFNSGFLAEGKWNKKLAEYVAEMTGAKVAVPTNSNGAGIVALLTIYKHYFGRKKVLIQSNTMYGVKTMVPSAACTLNGYIDCRLNTLMPGIDDVNNAIAGYSLEDKSELIILLSHIGGIINPDIIQIADLCKVENIILIEDCAHSFGATFYDQHSGLFGNAGVYSFYSTKAIPAGEGGVIVTNDEKIGQMAFDFSIYDRFNQKLEIGFNNRVSEPQALLSYSVVKEWENIVANKLEIAEKYINACKELDIQYIKQNENGHRGNYYKFILYHPEVLVSKYFPFNKTITSPVYDYSIGVENPVAENHLCLPIWYDQELEITNKVIEELYASGKT